MRHAGLDEAQAGIKIAGRNINHLRYAHDTILMEEMKYRVDLQSRVHFRFSDYFPLGLMQSHKSTFLCWHSRCFLVVLTYSLCVRVQLNLLSRQSCPSPQILFSSGSQASTLASYSSVHQPHGRSHSSSFSISPLHLT